MSEILVGYEVGTGAPVKVPLKHTAVLGQTQESGKTTTQEAMITRSGLRAIAFLTKRGEASFRLSTPVKPFFQEAKNDYFKYVIAAIEGMLEMKLGQFERQLILKLCRDYEKSTGAGKKKQTKYQWQAAESLQEVLQNVRRALPNLRGRDEGTAMQLEEYLKSVIPEIEQNDFADRLRVQPGINVMDVTRLSMGLQSLVISSVIEWVHEREKNTIVIIPEAWKFIPEGRSSAVKRAAERLIREGAALKNFVWIDSQDLRGIDKTIIRSVPVWLFGVQREKNEILNTLNSLPALPKPSATDIMGLKKGQFYVTHGDTLVKTYVRPAGMEAEHAVAIARGEESADSWKSIVRQLDEQKEAPDEEADASALSGGIGGDSAALEHVPSDRSSIVDAVADGGIRQRDAAGDDNRGSGVDSGEQPEIDDTGDSTPSAAHWREDNRLFEGSGPDFAAVQDRQIWPPHKCEGCDTEIPEGTAWCDDCFERIPVGDQHYEPQREEEMIWKERYDALKEQFDVFREKEYRPLVEAHDAMAEKIKKMDGLLRTKFENEMTDIDRSLGAKGLPSQEAADAGPRPQKNGAGGGVSTLAPPPVVSVFKNGGVPSLRDIYFYVRDRAFAEKPALLALLAERPEIEVTVEKRTIQTGDQNHRGRIGILIKEKFFDDPPRPLADVRREFIRRGWLSDKRGAGDLTPPIEEVVTWGFLTKESTGYQSVPGMKVSVLHGK